MKLGMKDHLPCGCPTVKHAVVLGIDGNAVHGVTAVDVEAGRLWLLRFELEPELIRYRRGHLTCGDSGVDHIEVEAPFELHCRYHPQHTPTWAEHEARELAAAREAVAAAEAAAHG